MIVGSVTGTLEAVVWLDIIDAGGRPQRIGVTVDMGFSGFLTLRPAVIAALGLVWVTSLQGVLAGGVVRRFDLYRADIVWDGQPRIVTVGEADGAQLLGMAMLEGHELNARVVPGGKVTISALP